MVYKYYNNTRCPLSLEEMLDNTATSIKFFVYKNERIRDREKFRIKTEIWPPEVWYYSKRGKLNPKIPDPPDCKIRRNLREIYDLGLIAELQSFARARPIGGSVSLIREQSVYFFINLYDLEALKDFLQGYHNPYLWKREREYIFWHIRRSANENYFRRWLDYHKSYIKGVQERIKEYI